MNGTSILGTLISGTTKPDLLRTLSSLQRSAQAPSYTRAELTARCSLANRNSLDQVPRRDLRCNGAFKGDSCDGKEKGRRFAPARRCCRSLLERESEPELNESWKVHCVADDPEG